MITVEEIKAQQMKLAALIAEFEHQLTFPITINAPQLNPGEKFVGVIISADGIRKDYLILLPDESEPANWQTQMEWAKSIGGELPDRVESALLLATMKDEFKPECYWTREQHASYSDYAWIQDFDNGYQDNYIEIFENRAQRRPQIANLTIHVFN